MSTAFVARYGSGKPVILNLPIPNNPKLIGTRMTMADGSTQDVYYNGFTGDEILGSQGMRQLGIEKIMCVVGGSMGGG